MLKFYKRQMTQEKITSSQRLFKANKWQWWVPRVLAGAVGLILLIAGLLKGTDMELFIRQIRYYGIISHYILLTISAWGLIVVECTLGAALLIFYRPRLTVPITAILLVMFLGVNSWAWLTDATKECGCFGAWLKRTPGEGVLEGLIMLASLVPAWVWHKRFQRPPTKTKAVAVVIACLMGLVLPVAFGFPISKINKFQSKTDETELGHLEIQGLKNVDLSRGDYLVILMDTDCEHCREAVPELNNLAEGKDIPTLIALTPNEDGKRKRFIEEFQPVFPIGQISEDDFWRLLGEGDIPRIILLHDRRVQRIWDGKVPDEAEIKKVRR
jgi:hypothetical protein